MRQRDPPQGYTFERLGKLADAAIDYAETFGLPVPALNSYADRTIIENHHIARNLKNKTPAAIAARARKAERDKAALESVLRDAAGHWRAGGNFSVPGLDRYRRRSLARSLPVLLRVNGAEIETTLGARFPIEHGKLAWSFILKQRMKAEAWQRNGHSIHLGHFVIDRIEPDGSVRAGCHTVAWDEIERMARTLGLLPPEPQHRPTFWRRCRTL